MSILLESLSQQSSPQDNKVPDIHVSHFDDDMLGDDWLLRRVKLWQWGCGILGALLIASWIFFYLQLNAIMPAKLTATTPALVPLNTNGEANLAAESNSSQRFEADHKKLILPTEMSDQNNGQNQAKQIEMPAEDNRSEPADLNRSQLANQESIKQTYVPRKRSQESVAVAEHSVDSKQKKRQEQVDEVPPSHYDGAAVWRDELSQEMQDKMPNIEVHSYVVADTPKDSFVILDGGFYKINQVIAPDLILREITQKYIVVEFQSTRVKLPFD